MKISRDIYKITLNTQQTGAHLTPPEMQRGTQRRNHHRGCEQDDEATTMNKERSIPPLAARRRRPSRVAWDKNLTLFGSLKNHEQFWIFLKMN